MNLKTMKTLYIVLTACLVIGGGFLLVWPNVGVSLLCKVFGAFLIIYGAAKVVGYFSKETYQLAFQFGLGLGIASIIIGIAMLVRTDSVVAFLAGGVGIFLLIDAALKIQTAIDARKFGIRQWSIIMAIAIVTGMVGAILLFVPHEATNFLVRLVGLSFLIDGVMDMIVVGNTYHAANKRIKVFNERF